MKTLVFHGLSKGDVKSILLFHQHPFINLMSSTRKCNALKEFVKLEYGTTQMLQSDNA
jgi:hypothetical protein